ncbi:MAG: hypothetical protein PHV17_04545 [Candidatus Omnitrophica bacterium]|nr:hypothetical protein [Candidatus Omnitrophota bacterium]
MHILTIIGTAFIVIGTIFSVVGQYKNKQQADAKLTTEIRKKDSEIVDLVKGKNELIHQNKQLHSKVDMLTSDVTILTEKFDELMRKLAKEKKNPNALIVAQEIKGNLSFKEVEIQNISPTPVGIKEAKLIFNPKNIVTIQESQNVSSITDNGMGDYTITFDKDFSNENYYIDIQGNKELNIKNVSKRKGSIRVQFDETNVEWIQIISKEK